MKILVLHGINLDMLGQRDPAQYGHATLADVDAQLQALAAELGAELACFQTNHEGALCERIHQALREAADGVVINAAAWTHTSVAIRDALEMLKCPRVEVHMSNIHAREPFRRHSYVAEVATGQICGFGGDSYLLGLRACVDQVRARQNEKN
jgi:3-dehydroquinate dehydratase-2